jgi:hypothetical protein
MIKGRVAEAIIKELFLINNYYVYDYGMERTLPLAVDNVRKQKDELSRSIRHMPDFLVQQKDSGQLTYVEVKYRAKGKFSKRDIENNPYKNTCFIIISKENIQWIEYSQLEAGSALPCDETANLEYCTIFDLDKDLVEQYKGYAKDFFEGVK